MDPQNQLSGLDPKLKEAYERVMGTTIPSASAPASPPPAPPQEPAPSAPMTQTEPLPPANQPSEPTPAQPPPVQEPTPPPVTPPQPSEPAESPLQQPELPPPTELASSPVQAVQPTGFVANAPKKEKRGGLKLSPPIIIVVGVALLGLYIFFWIRVFNLSLF